MDPGLLCARAPGSGAIVVPRPFGYGVRACRRSGALTAALTAGGHTQRVPLWLAGHLLRSASLRPLRGVPGRWRGAHSTWPARQLVQARVPSHLPGAGASDAMGRARSSQYAQGAQQFGWRRATPNGSRCTCPLSRPLSLEVPRGHTLCLPAMPIAVVGIQNGASPRRTPTASRHSPHPILSRAAPRQW